MQLAGILIEKNHFDALIITTLFNFAALFLFLLSLSHHAIYNSIDLALCSLVHIAQTKFPREIRIII